MNGFPAISVITSSVRMQGKIKRVPKMIQSYAMDHTRLSGTWIGCLRVFDVVGWPKVAKIRMFTDINGFPAISVVSSSAHKQGKIQPVPMIIQS